MKVKRGSRNIYPMKIKAFGVSQSQSASKSI